MFLNIFKNGAFTIFIALTLCFLTGCVTKSVSFEEHLSNNKSIVILPIGKSVAQVSWSKIGGAEQKNNFFAPYYGAVKIGNHYIAIPMDAGVYYIENISIKSSAYAYQRKHNITNTGEYDSAFGSVLLEKTPEKYEYYTYEHDKKGKMITKTVVEDIESYYKFYYSFNANNSIGTITIKPNEIVLAPAVKIDIELAHNSCKSVDVKENSFFDKFLESGHNSILGSFWDALGTDNGFDTWTWSCPVKAFIVDIREIILEDFKIYADVYKITYPPEFIFGKSVKREFSQELLERLSVRNFEFGGLFEQSKKAQSHEYDTWRYVISGAHE
ncbi:MAG: hypothetical protein LBF71_03320 [Campylobacteraceae bacterium]|jgi:hypothetical protein|nr:hypothetical protein [Campylobacteraceae bacterium]